MLTFAAILLAGAALRFGGLGRDSLWIDEVQSIWTASHAIRDIADAVRRFDQHPPGYYLLLHAWMALGRDESTLRLLSAFCGVLCLPLVFAIGRRLHSREFGFVMAALFASSAIHVQYAQEARMYAQFTLLAAAALWSMTLIVNGWPDPERDHHSTSPGPDPPSSPARRIVARPLIAYPVYVLSVTAALYTHNTAILVIIVAQAVVAMQWFRRLLPGGFFPRWLAAHAVIVLLYLPWFPALQQQAAQMSGRFWIPPVDAVVMYRTMGLLYTPSFEYAPAAVRYGLQALVALLALRGIWSLRANRSLAVTLLLAWLLPVVLAVVASFWKPVLLARTLLWTTIPFYAVMAAGALSFHRRGVRAVCVTGLIVLSLSGTALHFVQFRKEDWRGATAFVVHQAKESDLVLFQTATGRLVFEYYRRAGGPSLRLAGIPADPYQRGWEPRMTYPDADTLRVRVAGKSRLWLVLSHAWFSDPEGLTLRILRERFTVIPRGEFNGVDVFFCTTER